MYRTHGHLSVILFSSRHRVITHFFITKGWHLLSKKRNEMKQDPRPKIFLKEISSDWLRDFYIPLSHYRSAQQFSFQSNVALTEARKTSPECLWLQHACKLTWLIISFKTLLLFSKIPKYIFKRKWWAYKGFDSLKTTDFLQTKQMPLRTYILFTRGAKDLLSECSLKQTAKPPSTNTTSNKNFLLKVSHDKKECHSSSFCISLYEVGHCLLSLGRLFQVKRNGMQCTKIGVNLPIRFSYSIMLLCVPGPAFRIFCRSLWDTWKT